MRSLTLLALLIALPALAVPLELPHQGRLLDAGGAPLDGSHTLTFAIYADATGTTPLWTEDQSIDLDAGYYAASLGAVTPLDPSTFDGNKLYVGVAVDGGDEIGRVPLASVPYAILAGSAASVSGGIVDATEIRVNGSTIIDGSGTIVSGAPADTLDQLSCASGDVAEFDGSEWACAPNTAAHVHDAADTTTGTFDASRLPVGTGSSEVAAGDHGHDLSTLGGKVTTAQLPDDLDATVDALVVNAPLDLAAGSTLGGADLSTLTGDDAVAAVEAASTVTLSGALDAQGGIANRTWKLVDQDAFTMNTAESWAPGVIQSCGGLRMLHGYGQAPQTEVKKTFASLPAHTEVRIEFAYSFIDSWDGEKGYLKVDGAEKWSMNAVLTGTAQACGAGGWGDTLGVEASVELAHASSSIALAFGSTLNQGGTDESYGVSNIRVYVR